MTTVVDELIRRTTLLERRLERLVLPERGPRNNYTATGAPGVGDDSADGYGVGSMWIDVSADDAYVCLDGTGGAAVWKKTTP